MPGPVPLLQPSSRHTSCANTHRFLTSPLRFRCPSLCQSLTFPSWSLSLPSHLLHSATVLKCPHRQREKSMKRMEWVPHKVCTVSITICPSYAGNVTLGIMTTHSQANYYHCYTSINQTAKDFWSADWHNLMRGESWDGINGLIQT